MSRNAWIIFAVICVALVGGLAFMSQSNRVDVSDIDAGRAQEASEASGNISDWTKGTDEPIVTIVEYADFQCPGCAAAAPVLDEVIDRYGEHVQLIYRHFPLPGHQNARAAAAAAEAAGKQGQFWQMQQRLYESQAQWSQASGANRTDIFADYAESLGLDRDRFINDLTNENIVKKINFDASLGRAANVTGTPAIFVDGEQVDGYFAGDEIVDRSAEGARQLWTDADAFGLLVIEPKLREAGVELDN